MAVLLYNTTLLGKTYSSLCFNSQVFFVIRLIAGPTANSLPPITDTDPLMACDLMDGRDAFLTLARDKHLEFSSLRRSKWSSMCMLVELHNQSQDRFVYTCNECKHHVETRFHCTVCEVRICWNLAFSPFYFGRRSIFSKKTVFLWIFEIL